MKSLSKSVLWYSAGNLFVRFLSFILLPLYSNLIAPSEFGKYALLMSAYSIASIFYQSGLHAALTKFYLEEKDEQKRKDKFSTILNFIIVTGIIFSGIIFLFSKELSVLIIGGNDYSDLITILFSALFFETISFYVLHLLKTKEISNKVVFYSSIGAISNFVLNIILVYILREGVKGIFVSQLFSAVILIVILLPILKKEYLFKFNPVFLKQALRFSYPFIISGVLATAIDFSDRFILNHFLGIDEVGVYGFSYRIAMIMNVFVISFRTAWTPHALNLFNIGDYKARYSDTFIKFLALGSVVLLIVSLLANELFSLNFLGINIFNDIYKPGIVILPYVLLGYLFNGLSSFYSVYPLTSGKSFHFLFSDGLGLAINLILNIIFIPVIGILGAAIATTISFSFSAFYLFIISKNKIQIDYHKKKNIWIVLPCLIFLITGLYLNNLLVNIIFIIIYLIIIKKFVKLNWFEVLRFSK
ncbi:MAG TPA: hypothetical protein ENI57_07880 [Ignavibacteria bacterium]|nr:hypothetical protein [Ignavibacteria bacterium]